MRLSVVIQAVPDQIGVIVAIALEVVLGGGWRRAAAQVGKPRNGGHERRREDDDGDHDDERGEPRHKSRWLQHEVADGPNECPAYSAHGSCLRRDLSEVAWL